ncbi:YdeI/OmpD-associated family protein [Blastopirellula sp. J2-11]|uniref:YdeI/OmpD-associated family protein n=1 Tax=Blastopirellula sp. J2-11 TaxID=2943192 RepID=UPI0021C6A5B0|nr:YdeI/OmpD-associated family protein [Blastopirellula sp. J2-11]UUO05451.1 YdeI/OmpD-associated family protein [Blastopirellula sp. J2-11]
MPEPSAARTRAFPTPKKFNAWLAVHHATETELWLKIHKKASGLQSITWQEAVIEALCWGWIDGVKKSLDDISYLQRFTPRRPKSNWSQRNREHVERLLAENRMQEPGLAHVRAAQADGRWDAAYAPSSEVVVPADFVAAVRTDPSAKAFFATLNKANLFAIAYQLQTAKKPETRQRRFDNLLAMLKSQTRIH